MSSVDSRIVTAKFDNAQFERGAAETMSTLDKLKRMLTFDGAKNGLNEVQRSANGFTLHPMTSAIEGVNKAWLGLAGVALSVINRITNAAIDAGKKAASNFTGPIMDGFHEYETTLNSVQTILANTGLRGEKGLAKVNHALDELNTFSDKTIYNFTQMASNVGTFTAAGVKLKTSTAAIKGIADIAAVSGSNAEQAATGMYQLSQAIATGTVRLQDWLSVEHAGFGGKIFQDALKRTARNHGIAVDAMIKKNGSFRNSLKENWLSSKILTETLGQFTGDLTDAQLRSMGYSDKQITKIQRLAKTAVDAATKVKTMSQLMGTLKEAAGSGWAKTWSILLGNFGEAKSMFTSVNDVLGGFIQRSADARNKVLGDWKKLGGRTLLIDSIRDSFHAVLDILGPIKAAFRSIFPPKTGQDLFNLTQSLHNFTDSLKVSKDTQEGLKKTFAGFFAIIKIGTTIFGDIFKLFFSLFSLFKGDGQGSILKMTGNFGDMLVALEKFLVEGGAIDGFFNKIKTAIGFLKPVVDLFFRLGAAIQTLVASGATAFFVALQTAFSGTGGVVTKIADAFKSMGDSIKGALAGVGLGGIFDGFTAGASKASDGLSKVDDAFQKTSDVASATKDKFAGVVSFFKGIGSFFAAIAHGISAAFSVVKDQISGLGDDTGEGLSNVLAVINTGFLTALVITIRNIAKTLDRLIPDVKGTVKQFRTILDQVTNNLKTMQTELRAKAILEIAAALALLAAALYILSKVDVVGLGQALVAVAILMKLLTKALGELESETKKFGSAARVVVLAGALVLLGLAVLAMAGAVAIFGNMDTGTLVKGLTAVGIVIGTLTAAALGLEKSGGASAMLVAAIGIGVLAVALTAFAGALLLYAALDTKKLAEGGLKAAAAIVGIGIAMAFIPPDMIGSAAALLIVAAALNIMAGAFKILGGMSILDLAKAVYTLDFALATIAGTMVVMSGTASGAASLLLVAAALAVLVPSLVILGNLDILTLVKALGALAAIFIVFGAAAIILSEVVPVMLALGGAVALLGLGIALIGGGLLALSIGLATLAASGAAGVAVLTAGIIAIAELFPLIMYQFGLGLKALAVVISTAGPQLIAAFSTVLGALITAVIKNTPKLAKMLMVLIDNGLKVLVHAIPRMVVAGIKIIMGILEGVRDATPKFVKTAAEVVVAWIVGLGKQVKKLAEAAAKFIVDFINGVSTAIDNNAAALGEAGTRLAGSIIKGIVKGIAAGIPLVVDAAKKLAKGALDAAKHFLGIHSPSKEFEKLGRYVDQGFAKGIVGGLDDVKSAMGQMQDMIKESIDANKKQVDDLKDQLKTLKEEPKKNAKEIEKVTAALATAEDKLKKSKAARDLYKKGLADERASLVSLSKQYDDYTTQIDDAKKALEDATKARDDFEASTASKFSALPDITETTTVEEYAAAIAKQDADVETFRKSLETLRNMGLSDAQYQQFLDEGVGIQPFLDELIANGPNAVSYITGLTSTLGSAAATLGHTAAIEMKQAGVDAAQGLLDGLISKRGDIAAQMTEIARIMVRAIKKELKSHSPSKVMEEIGKFTNEGLAQGLDKTARMVAQSATNTAQGAVDAMKSTLQGISTAVMTDVNTNPTITPVLDLTQVTKDAGALNNMMDKTFVAKVSTGQAQSISTEQAAMIADKLETLAAPVAPQEVKFEQNNYSPKALSRVEIYRDTKNVISLAKEALKTP